MTQPLPDPAAKDRLALDYGLEAERIARWMRETVARRLKRRGLVVAVSGGIDSSVSAALAVRAVGKERVYGLLLPERDSSGETGERGKMVVEHLGIAHERINIAPALGAIGCYSAIDGAMKRTFPDYGPGWKSKITLANPLSGGLTFFNLVVARPDGTVEERRLERDAYLEIVAATNYKQRLRKTIEYFHADRLHYAVVGTPNRLEYDQGFFVKNGDGSADIKPIAHLYKTQVYRMARFLGLPEAVVAATPTTDTYSMAQGQDEFYFALPYGQMDVALHCFNAGEPAATLAAEIGVPVEAAEAVYRDIAAKRSTTAYLHAKAITIEPIAGVGEI
jgi:NAD+ synthase